MSKVRPVPSADPRDVAVGVQAVYNAVAHAYDAEIGDELESKPLDRALLEGFVELAGTGTIGDVGCGPGHVTRYLAARHPDVIGIDVSPGMVAVARRRAPELPFVVASMLQLPVPDGTLAGVLAMYSVIHLVPQERVGVWEEFARTLRPRGWLLAAFHVDSADYAVGQVSHLTSWFGEQVALDGYFLDPAEIAAELAAAGLEVMATLERQPIPAVEYPSRRCYVLAQRC